MTRLRHSTAIAATIAAALLLTACGGAEATMPGASATASLPSAGKASPAVEKTMEQVLSDLRYAAKNVGEDHLRVVEDPRAAAAKVPPCMAAGAILTPEIPGRAELTLVTHRLRTRGWKLHGALDVEFTMLSSGKWDIMLGAGPVPEEIAAQAGDSKGGFGISVTGVCKKPS